MGLIETTDHIVSHVTLAYNATGDEVGIFVRECVSRHDHTSVGTDDPVLFVHGGVYPALPDFDLPVSDYSWMGYLARSGLHAFAMDCVGYGRSSRLGMDRPDQADPEQAATIDQRFWTVRSPQSDWADIDAVVSFILKRTGKSRLNLVGWSAGGARAGGYAALHPDLVNRVVLLAPAYDRSSPDTPFGAPNEAGPPLRTTTREKFAANWDRQVKEAGQFDPAIRDIIWSYTMECDPTGASWDPPVIRGPTLNLKSITRGWNAGMAARVTAPTLIIAMEWDADVPPPAAHALFEDLGTAERLFAQIAGSSHYIPWERHRGILHAMSRSWLIEGAVLGRRTGELHVEANG